MNKYILAFFLFFCGGMLAAQVVTVRDAKTQKPLASATLFTDGHHQFAVTNAEGQADLSEFDSDATVYVRLLGYESMEVGLSELAASNYVIDMNRSNFNLDQIVISATRRVEKDRLIPNKIVKIDPKFIALENPQTAADLLGTSGEVFIQKSQQGGGSPMIRGFATNRLLIAVDGVRMNTAIFRSGNLQNVISLDPFAMESAEVIFGPGSVLYGSDAIGGVMTFRTLTPQLSYDDEPLVTGKAVSRFSSANNELTTHFDVNVGGRKWASVSSFTFSRYGDLRMGSHGPDDYLREFSVVRLDSVDRVKYNEDPQVQLNSGYRQSNIMQKIRFKPNGEWDFNYGFHYSTTSDVPRYDRLVEVSDGTPSSAEWYYGPQDWMLNNLTIDHRKRTAAYDLLTLTLAQQTFEESRIDRKFNNASRRERTETVDAYSANLDLTKSVGEKGQLIYGAEWVYNDVRSVGIRTDINTGEVKPTAPRYPESSWTSFGVYGAYRHSLSEKITLNAGARYSGFELDATFEPEYYALPFETANLSNGALTGNVGAIFQASEKTRLTAVVATGFRAPNIDDMGKIFDSEKGSVVVPNPDLQAEYATNFEVGISHLFGDWLRMELTGYYTMLDDALVRRNFTLSDGRDSLMYDGEMSRIQAIQNAAKAEVYGLQASADVKLTGGFGLSAQFNYQSGEEEMDDGSKSPGRHVAPMFGIARFTYETGSVRLELNAVVSDGLDYDELNVGERGKPDLYAKDANGNPYSPSWYTLNFKVMASLNNHWSISGGVENITDQRYRPYSSGIAGAGRNLVLSLRAGF